MVRLATRGSELARWQAGRVAALLRASRPGLEVELVPVTTTGDRRREVPVWEMGGRGVFVREVQAAVLSGGADAAVHSAKDLQPVEGEGLRLAAVPERADPRDALVGSALAQLAKGAAVATGSQRRRAQLAFARPDLCFESLRGNIGTRLGKIPPGGAIVVAMAALDRLGLAPEPMEALSPEVMLPQVAQGAIAVECREGDTATAALLGSLDDPAARTAVEAERAFLAAIGGACDLPVAGHATLAPDGALSMEGLLAAPDGTAVVRRRATAAASAPGGAAELGRRVADLVLEGGGRELLASFRAGR
ncbi:MAG: hydroxymethylbilane synthase [Acidimicrobiales bacterium]